MEAVANLELWNTRWWNLLCSKYPLQGFSKPQIMFNKRLKTTAGMSYMDTRIVHISWELYLEHTNHIVTNTIPHELCHQVAWDVYQHSGHGKDWKSVMVKLGLPPDRLHTMVNTKHEARKAGVK